MDSKEDLINTERVDFMNDEQVKKIMDDDSKIFIITLSSRPGSLLFTTTLEYTFFPPSTEKNNLFTILIINWQQIHFAVVSVPKEYEEHCITCAKKTGMILKKGCLPMIFVNGNHELFPFANKKKISLYYTLENEPGHPIYKNGGVEAFSKIEEQLCEKIFEDNLK